MLADVEFPNVLWHEPDDGKTFSLNVTYEYAFNWRQSLLPVYWAYALPSFAVYYIVRKSLARTAAARTHKHFHWIFANDFLISVLLFITDFSFSRVPIAGLFPGLPGYVPRGLFLNTAYFLSYYFIYANYFSITLICINRLTSIICPYTFAEFWTRNIKYAIVLVYFLPLLVTWQIFTYRVELISLGDGRYQMGYWYTPVLPHGVIRNSTALSLTSFVLTFACLAANSVTIVRFRIRAAQMEGSSLHLKERQRRIEVSLVSIAVVSGCSLLLQCILQTSMMILGMRNERLRQVCQDLRVFAIDISVCCPPWILYYSSRPSRANQSKSETISLKNDS